MFAKYAVMTMLIADGGSTKTEWALVEENNVRILVTEGINPVHMTAAEIETILCREFTLSAGKIDVVRFYGAGCIPAKCSDVSDVLRKVFGTEDVTVESDLLGAARGLLGDGAGVIGILGTGSNSALYDGSEMVHHVPPLGYILGDEGSGADLGKRLLGNILKGLMPEDVTEAFYKAYPLEYTAILDSVYRSPGTNRFLAGFCPFLSNHIDHPAVCAIVERAFSDFTERNLMQYAGIRELPVSFTGSVACYFEKPLRNVLKQYGLTAGKIERTPMPGLIGYHQGKRN